MIFDKLTLLPNDMAISVISDMKIITNQSSTVQITIFSSYCSIRANDKKLSYLCNNELEIV